MKQVKRRSDCPVSFALDIFGDKWTLLVVRDLMLEGKEHFGEFLTSEEGIATNILADRLQRLEEQGVISKKRDPKKKTKLIYSLTQKGIDLLPIILELILWSSKYDQHTGVPKEFVARIREDKEDLIKQIRLDFKQNKFLFPKE